MGRKVTKTLIAPFRAAFQTGDTRTMREALLQLFAPHATIRLGHPFGELTGPEALWDKVYAPLTAALPDLERRDFITMSGPEWRPESGTPHGRGQGAWIGLGGNMVGTFRAPWLGIPATAKPVHLRYHEYLRIEDDQVVEMEALWDLPELMAQARVWPMDRGLGVSWMCPGPAAHDPQASGPASVRLVWDMLHDLQQGTATAPERGLGGFWHPHALWHGPTGLGTARGHADIAHSIFKGFRTGLSDNTRHLHDGVFFGEGDLVAFTGWPSATARHTGEGFLGLAPTGREITRRSLDFWRVEAGLVRECWVMVDLIDLYRQLGINVFSRMQALIGELV